MSVAVEAPAASPSPTGGAGAGLRLCDLIRLAGVALDDFKIHFATGAARNDPLEAFLDGRFEAWQARQGQRNFECRQVIGLIQLGPDRWLFAGLWRVLGRADHVKPQADGWAGHTYKTEPVGDLEHLAGRAVVRYKKAFRASYVWGEKYGDRLTVCELRPRRLTVGEFPGFNDVLLSFTLLKTVVREALPTWKASLGNVAGVYLIVDTTTGRQYVGSASGGVGVWQRWSSYADTGHGGNRDLRGLLDREGPGHADRFQFSLLEVCDLGASTEFVLSRESHWKTVLRSREFGLNAN